MGTAISVGALANLFSTFGAIVEGSGDPMNLNRSECTSALAKFGLLVFRGFNFDGDTFRSFSDAFMSQVLTHGARSRNKVSDDGTVVEVTRGQNAMCLHREMAYVPWSPSLLWFHCVKAPDAGGQTTFGSGKDFALKLKSTTCQLLLQRPIVYRHKWPKEARAGFFGTPDLSAALEKLDRYQSVQIVSATEDLLEFEYKTRLLVQQESEVYFLNSFMNMLESAHLGLCTVTFEDGAALPSAIIEEFKSVEEQIIQPHTWKNGDVVLVDNNKIMHGRRDFSGERTIHVRFGSLS